MKKNINLRNKEKYKGLFFMLLIAGLFGLVFGLFFGLAFGLLGLFFGLLIGSFYIETKKDKE